MPVTRKQCFASAKRCNEYLAKYNAAKENHGIAALELSRCRDQILHAQDELRRCEQEKSDARRIYKECLVGHDVEIRLRETKENILEIEETLYRIRDEIKDIELYISNFSEENLFVKESQRRRLMTILRNDYNEHESCYVLNLKEYTKLENQRRVSSSTLLSAELDYLRKSVSHTEASTTLETLNNKCISLIDIESCLNSEVLKAQEKYLLAEKEQEALVECYKKSIKRKKQLRRTLSSKVKKIKIMTGTKKKVNK